MKTATSCCLALLLAAPPIRAETRQPLASIPEITRLEPEIAVTEIPVELRATVTFCKPEISTLLVHDGNQGVYVWRDILPADAGPRTGDLVLVRGVTKPGDFSPSIGGPGTAAAEVKVLSSGDLPVPETIEGPDLGIPEKDCDWVSLEAEVLEVIIRYGDLVLECRAGGFDFFILLKGPLPADAVPWGAGRMPDPRPRRRLLQLQLDAPDDTALPPGQLTVRHRVARLPVRPPASGQHHPDRPALPHRRTGALGPCQNPRSDHPRNSGPRLFW